MRTFTTSSLLMFSVLTTTEETCGNTTDADGDGWYTCQSDGMGELCDCNDAVPYIHPYGNEASTSGDDDCDGVPEWGVQLEYPSADSSFYSPVLLDDDTLIVGYMGKVCSFSLGGEFQGCFVWGTTRGGYCNPSVQLINSEGQLVIAGPWLPDYGEAIGLCFMVIDTVTKLPIVEYFDLPADRSVMTAITQAPDGGYLVSGGVKVPNDQYQGSLMKLKSTGEVEWTKNYGAPTPARFRYYFQAMAQTTSGDLVLVGSNCDVVSEGCNWVVRTDAEGVVKWTLQNAELNDIFIHPLVSPNTTDGVVLAGNEHLVNDGAIYDLDKDGSITWAWPLPTGGSGRFMTHWDGSVTSTGAILDPVSLQNVLTTHRITNEGQTAWEDRAVAVNVGGTTAIMTLPDGSYIITGSTTYPDDIIEYEYQNAVIMRLDAEANPPPFSVVEYP